MDKHSEVEAKFVADHVSVPDLFGYIGDNCERFQVLNYKDVSGWDAYYQQGDRFLRHRCDGRRHRSVLTVKQRKSEASIHDRHEVDLPLRDDVTADDVTAFLRLTGWVPYFKIDKRSYIWHLVGGDGVLVTLALYDVFHGKGCSLSQPTVRRFLEVEVEKDNNCTENEGCSSLDRWVEELQTALRLKAPMNASLFEIYKPRTEGDRMYPYPPAPGSVRGVWPDGRTGTEPVEKLQVAMEHGFKPLDSSPVVCGFNPLCETPL